MCPSRWVRGATCSHEVRGEGRQAREAELQQHLVCMEKFCHWTRSHADPSQLILRTFVAVAVTLSLLIIQLLGFTKSN